jgi:virulence-associated protein VagC
MKAKVTKQGLLIPKEFLPGIQEVEIRQQQGTILIVPIVREDPILGLGQNSVNCDVQDAAENHDKYLYSCHHRFLGRDGKPSNTF